MTVLKRGQILAFMFKKFIVDGPGRYICVKRTVIVLCDLYCCLRYPHVVKCTIAALFNHHIETSRKPSQDVKKASISYRRSYEGQVGARHGRTLQSG